MDLIIITKYYQGDNKKQVNDNKKQVNDINLCFACGKDSHNFSKCKYKEYKCKLCNNKGHIVVACKNKRKSEKNNFIKSEIKEQSSAVELYGLYKIEKDVDFQKKNKFNIELIVNNIKVNFEIDTGSAVSVCSDQFYFKYFNNCHLNESEIILKSYNGNAIKPLGFFDAQEVFM